jgi:hypothetical protein
MKGKKKGKDFKIVCAGPDKERQDKEQILLSLYPKKFDYIASGATPTGSGGRAPDEDEIINFASKEGNYGTHNGANY